jgi:hypothetical protein
VRAWPSSRRVFDYPSLRQELGELERAQSEPDFWSDQEAAGRVVKRVSHLKSWTDPVEAAEAKAEELSLLAELAAE